ncbi:MAG: hypothetical protein CLLPBCKN_006723 [Chroococcidiopsis cubana SAG 39.79]|nr:hypothetical protein [Chroococcidiopsis cubana SAG 39.79]
MRMHRSQNQLENSSTLLFPDNLDPNNLDQTKALGALKTAHERW